MGDLSYDGDNSHNWNHRIEHGVAFLALSAFLYADNADIRVPPTPPYKDHIDRKCGTVVIGGCGAPRYGAQPLLI